ncbi:MAG TPA: hypothetical protein VL086_18540 [Candidatus Nitrosotalea sp.]|nr:hypothetical protein [Candidatus Nitrosotalea sp.]
MSPADDEDLRAILSERFARMDEQFGRVNEQLGRMDEQFRRVDEQFGRVNEQFTRIDRRFEVLMFELDRRFTRQDERIAAFQAEVDERFREVFGHFDEVYGRLERLEQEYYAMSQQLRRIEVALTDESGRRTILERDLAALKEHVGRLQQRIAEMERRLGA